jgi:hypothetical protein
MDRVGGLWIAIPNLAPLVCGVKLGMAIVDKVGGLQIVKSDLGLLVGRPEQAPRHMPPWSTTSTSTREGISIDSVYHG